MVTLDVMALGARRNDPEASRTAILDAAEALFVAKGFEGVSMSEIAERSNVAKSLIHHHFGTKEGLWGEVKRRRFGEYHARQMALYALGRIDAETIRASMEAYFGFLCQYPQYVRLIQWMRLEGDRECVDMVAEARRLGIERLGEAQSNGVVRDDVPAEHVLMVFLALCHGFFLEGEFVADGSERKLDPREYLATAWKTFRDSMLVSR
jgi:TetR/AcrR family transcriptional regulator